jgi:hypothetical protein
MSNEMQIPILPRGSWHKIDSAYRALSGGALIGRKNGETVGIICSNGTVPRPQKALDQNTDLVLRRVLSELLVSEIAP